MKCVIAAVCVLWATSASAQVTYPGSVWSSNGWLTPVERHNVISLTHAEQGVEWRGLELFGQSTLSADTKGYDWNRRYQLGIGGRFTQSIGSGMVRGSVSWLRENRYNHDVTAQGLVLAAETWFGWQRSPRPAKVQ